VTKFRLLQPSTNLDLTLQNLCHFSQCRETDVCLVCRGNEPNSTRSTWHYRISLQQIKCSWPSQL